MEETFVDVCEFLEWKVTQVDQFYEIEMLSPAGEDFIFYIDAAHPLEDLQDYIDDFDPYEHASEWIEAKKGNVSGIPDNAVLIQDALEIQESLKELEARAVRVLVKKESLQSIIKEEIEPNSVSNNGRAFDTEGFLDWYNQSFSYDNRIPDIINNLVWYAETHFVGKDALANFLADMLPEVSFSEVCAFCSDEMLTPDGREQKREQKVAIYRESQKKGMHF